MSDKYVIYSLMRVTSFTEWIQAQLKQLGMSQAELSRRTGLSTGHVSMIVNGDRDPGPDACKAIAKAFDLPESVVFQAAGLLTGIHEEGEGSALKTMAHSLFDRLDVDDQEELVQFMRLKIQRKESRKGVPPKTRPGLR